MTGWYFIKACRDSKVLALPRVTRTDCDIVFSQLKDGTNTLSLQQFRRSLELLAERTHNPVATVVDLVAALGRQQQR